MRFRSYRVELDSAGSANATGLQELTHEIGESPGALDVVSPKHASSKRDAKCVRCVGRIGSVGYVSPGEQTQEALVACTQEGWVAGSREFIGSTEQFGRHGRVLAEVERRVNHDAMSGNSRLLCPPTSFDQVADDVGNQVVIERVRIIEARGGAHVTRNNRCACFACEAEVVGIGESAGVITYRSASGETLAGNSGTECIDRDRHIESLCQRGDRGNDSIDLFLDPNLVAGLETDTTNVKEVGSVSDMVCGLRQKFVETKVLATVEERIGRAVEDAHNQRARADIEGMVGAELKQHGANLPAPGGLACGKPWASTALALVFGPMTKANEVTDESDRFPVSIKGVIIRDEKVLLARNHRDEWELPGGRIGPDETPRDALVREIREETGLIAEPSPTPIDSYLFDVGDGSGQSVFIVTYGCVAYRPDTAVVSSEHLELRWFPLADAVQLPDLPPGYRASISAWRALSPPRHT